MRIAEVSKQFGISADTLRYYERIGLLSHVHRNESGIRDYGEQDLARIRFVKCMRGANVSIEALIEYRAATPPSGRARPSSRRSARRSASAWPRCRRALTALTTRLPTTRTSSSRPSRRWSGGPNRRRAFYLHFFSACTNLSRPDTPSRKRGRICAAWAPPAGANGAVCRFPRRLRPSELPCKPAVRLWKEKCKRLR